MRIEIPGHEPLEIHNLLVDFNGTLAQGGNVSAETLELVRKLSRDFRICVATADTRGNASAECASLPVEILELAPGVPKDAAKLQLLEEMGIESTVAFGNGRNDALILAKAALGVCVMGEEGAHKMAIAAAEVVVGTIVDGLRLIAEPKRLIATLRN